MHGIMDPGVELKNNVKRHGGRNLSRRMSIM